MGLFSKKPKEPVYDEADCKQKKQQLREIFNSAVKDGKDYEILYCYMTSSKFEHGFVLDTNTTSFFYYIVGYRKSDMSIVLVQISADLGEHSEPCYLEMDKIVDVSYNPKYSQLCLRYEKGHPSYSELLNIGGTNSNTKFGPKNIYQPEEINHFLDFAEELRAKLEGKGYKLEKWKR